MSKTVELSEFRIRNFLDNHIRHWRMKEKTLPVMEQDMAAHYIDAFQLVRKSIFGEALPE